MDEVKADAGRIAVNMVLQMWEGELNRSHRYTHEERRTHLHLLAGSASSSNTEGGEINYRPMFEDHLRAVAFKPGQVEEQGMRVTDHFVVRRDGKRRIFQTVSTDITAIAEVTTAMAGDAPDKLNGPFPSRISPTPEPARGDDFDIDDTLKSLAECPTTDETPGVARDRNLDEIIYLARKYVKNDMPHRSPTPPNREGE